MADNIFSTITALAAQHDAINLGQGFPDFSGPERMLSIASQEILNGNNQYAPLRGLPTFLTAVSEQRERDYGLSFDPETEIVATVGATEGIAATVLSQVGPNDEVICFEPYYDAYAAAIDLAGGRRVSVPLIHDDSGWQIDTDAFRRAISPSTRLVIINNPHNPTGAVLDLTEFSGVCREHDLTVLSDEAYEYLVYDGRRHVPTAAYPGMRERTVTVGSAAKTFAVTGWKTGWALGPTRLIAEVTAAKQYLTFVGFTPAQPAIAYALREEMGWVSSMVSSLQEQRDLLASSLREAGLKVLDSQGTFFLLADVTTHLSPSQTGADWCRALIKKYGVAAIPVEVFADHPEKWSHLVRFTYCKGQETMAEARRRLSRVGE